MELNTKSGDAIRVENLSKRFGTKQALSKVNFNVPCGSIFGFLGPNGAGKTTTIRCMMNFINPDTAGSISILGKDSNKDSTYLKRSIGYLSSDSQLNPNWTGQEHISLFEAIKGKGKYRDKLIERLGLDVKTKVKMLSSGNKQKLSIVLSFIGNPQLLIMDEPTRGLDPLLQNELYNILTEYVDSNKTVFFSSHNLGEVERICDTVLLIKDGSVVEENTMDSIREMKVHMISATSSGSIDVKKLKSLPNVQVLESSKTITTLKVKGDINSAMKILIKENLTDLSVAHASLEDVFLEQYRD